jgi:hypothetical protein
MNDEDMALKSQIECVERLFKKDIIKDTPQAAKEKDIVKIASSMFLTCFNIEEQDEILYGPKWGHIELLEEYRNKAEKLYDICGEYETSAKVLNILKVIDVDLSKQFVEKL